MSTARSCFRGHSWEADGKPGLAGICPVCGAPAQPLLPSAAADAADDLESTIQERPGTGALPLLGGASEPLPTLPDFEVLGELGRGGMGIVYKARELRKDRLVALKVIRKDRLQHEEAVRRFRREAQAASRLLHPNIVHVFDSDHSGSTHYLVMEYVDGMTLERLVELKGPLTLERACDFVRQAALGLQHAQDMALVHRDIKPTNLMVTPPPRDGTQRGGNGALGYQIKILDMGVARVLQLGGQSPSESLSTLTHGGSVIGTADYIAPEQLEDPHGADIRADLYSLGCTFYFLLTGQVPFPGGSLVSKLDKQRWETPTSIHQLRDDVPPAVATLVQKLMAKKPADRFQTPAELVQALDELVRTGFSSSGAPAPSLKERRRLLGHAEPIWSAAFTPDGKLVVSGGKDRQMLLWDVDSGVRVRDYPRHAQEIRAVAFSPEGDRIVSASGISLRLWDAVSGEELRRLSGHTGAVKCVAFAPDGRRLASAGDDKSIRIWDLQNGRELQRLARHSGEVTGLALSGDGELLVSGSRDQTLRVWDLRSGQEVRVIHTGGGAILGLALTRSARLAVSAHFDTVLRLWDLDNGREVRRFVGHKQMVTAVALLPDEQRIVSAGQDQSVRLWDLESGRELAGALEPRGGINCVAAAAQGNIVLSAGGDRSIGIWELPDEIPS